MLETYAAALVGLFLAQVVPGPNFLAVVGVALGHGRRLAFHTVAGLATGTLVWLVLFALGLGAAIAAFPALLTALKLLGGGYLLVVAGRALVSALARETPTATAAVASLTEGDAFRRGLLVVLTNPKSALMWAAISTFLFGGGLGIAGVLAFGPPTLASALLVYGTCAWVFSTRAAGRVHARFARPAALLLAAAFGLIGGHLAVDGVGDLLS